MVQTPSSAGQMHYFYTWQKDWIPQFGISLHFAVDGLSILMSELTVFIGLAAVVSTWNEIKRLDSLFYFNLNLVLAGVLGVFLTLDLFLFYFFWELMIIPMFIIINIWGYAKKERAAIKFFLFTQVSGLLMLVAILALYFIHGRHTGVYTFNFVKLTDTPLSTKASLLLMIGFVIAFGVKLPVFPVHVWLPDAHSEAPTAGSVILAALMLKTGAFGLLRYVIPLFHDSLLRIAPLGMGLAVAGILYGGFLSYSQTNLKRLIAYTSISHLGFVFMGIFVGNVLVLQGIVVLMISHALSTGSLFIFAGYIHERTGTLDMNEMGGFMSIFPRLSGFGVLFALGAMGLPGLGTFVGEFLILLGTFEVFPVVASIASLALIVSVIYALFMVRKVLHGPGREEMRARRLNVRESSVMVILTILLLLVGLFPRPVFRTLAHSLGNYVPTEVLGNYGHDANVNAKVMKGRGNEAAPIQEKKGISDE
jgi:NADH-quinone oxidoreductase subunit M